MKTLLTILLLLTHSLLWGQTIKGKYNPNKNRFETKDTTYKVGTFQNGVALVSNNDNVGLINTKGKILIPLKYKKLTVLTNGLFAAFNGEKWGVINKEGSLILPHKYDGITWYGEDSVGIASIRELEVVRPTGLLSGTMYGWGYYFDDSGLFKKESVPVQQHFGNVEDILFGGYPPISLVPKKDSYYNYFYGITKDVFVAFGDSVAFHFNKHYFSYSVFDVGEKTHLTPECAFYFECDCCFDQLLFDSDSTFIVMSHCTEKTSVSQGKYEIKENVLNLHYSGVWKHRYMIPDEQGKATEYAIKTYTSIPKTEVYVLEVCKNSTLFTEQNKPEIKMQRSEESLEKQLGYLKKLGLVN